MKLNKIFAVMLAVVAFAFMACNKSSEDVIKLKIKTANLEVGDTYKIPVEKASGAITWASSAEAVATVDAEGTVTAVAEGQAAITATVGTAKATVDVTVAAGGQTGGAPDLDAPENGTLRVVIEIPAGSECHGIALKGTLGEPNEAGDGYVWSGENTYIGENGAATPVDGKIFKFEAIEGYDGWFKMDVPAAEAMEFKVCLIYAGDTNWEGQAKDVALHSCNFSNIEPTIAGDGQVKEIGANGGLLYLSIGGWNKSECVVEVLKDVKVTLIVPTDDCGFEVPVVVGSFCGWDIANAVLMTAVEGAEGKYEATIQAYPSDEFKFAGSESGWANEPVEYNAEEDEWYGISNIPVGDNETIEADLSTFKWKACQENGGEE